VNSKEKSAVARTRRGLLVPVANPIGVAPLITIAVAASEPDDPPPRVLALVQPTGKGGRSEPGQSVAPRTPALLTAIECAQSHGAAIDARTMWSENPPVDIIAAAHAANVAWVLLGYHRAAHCSDTMGGVVREVFAMAKGRPINVGVFVQGTDRPFERIFAAVDAGPDGRAALALASRIAKKNRRKLHVLLVPRNMTPDPEEELLDMLRDARARIGQLLHSDVLTTRSLHQLFRQSPGRLLVVGRKFADEVRLPLEEVPGGGRCVIVVHGAETDLAETIGSRDHR
jgi:hypothetical protein